MIRARAVRALATAALLAASACRFGLSTQATPVEHVPRVPDKFSGDAPPELVDAGIDGCKRAQALDPNLYFCTEEEHWFRYAMNRWYMAFAWNGNWFPVVGSELPRPLAALTPAPEEVKKSREERLKELEKELEKLDPEQTPKSAD